MLNPDQIAVAPQISLIMANRTDLSADFAEFRINPEFHGTLGGVKIDTWRGPIELDESVHISKDPLNLSNDLVRLTTVAEVDGSSTLYRVSRLSSQQWGNVDSSLLKSCRTTGNGQINYSVRLTMRESEIEYGHNMVNSVFLREIRYYTDELLTSRNRTGYYLYRDGRRFIEPESDEEIIDDYTAY